MENKKVIIAIVIVLMLIIGIISTTYILNDFNIKQTDLLTEESNKILQSDISKDNIDFNIKTDKNYAIVEKSIKEYISELRNIYVEIEELNTGINPNNIFSAQNMQDKDLNEIEDIIKDYKEKAQNYILELEEMLKEENISANITKKDISPRKDYYIDLYNTVMLSEVMEKQYSLLEGKVKDEKSELYEKINKVEKVKDFLEDNKQYWIIKEDKIQFINLNKMTEYYNLLNKLID